jgi:hypothetical protein
LTDKLGWKPGFEARVLGCPEPLRAALAGLAPTPGGALFQLLFVRDQAALEARALAAIEAHRAVGPGAVLWIAYPKLSGAIASDLTRDRGWEALAAADFLAVRQIALDDDWSALRFRPRSEIPRVTRRA